MYVVWKVHPTSIHLAHQCISYVIFKILFSSYNVWYVLWIGILTMARSILLVRNKKYLWNVGVWAIVQKELLPWFDKDLRLMSKWRCKLYSIHDSLYLLSSHYWHRPCLSHRLIWHVFKPSSPIYIDMHDII